MNDINAFLRIGEPAVSEQGMDKGHLSVKEVDQFVTLLSRLATVEMERDAMREVLQEMTTLAEAYMTASYTTLDTKSVREHKAAMRVTFIAHGVKRLPAETIRVARALLSPSSEAGKGEV